MIEFLTLLEKRKFYTEFLYSKVQKVFLFLFFNTGIIIIFIVHNIMQLQRYSALFGQNGVVYNIQSIMLFSLITPFLWSLFHPAHLFKTFRYRRTRRQLTQNPRGNTFIQTEANQVYEKSNFDIEFKYFCLLKTLCVAFFYQLIIPYGLLFAMLEMGLFYLTDRFSLTSRCLRLKNFDFVLTLEVLSYFDFCLMLIPLGYIVMYRHFFNIRGSFILIMTLALTVLEAFVINFRILFACCKSCRSFEPDTTNFRDVRFELKTYNESNPATMNFYMYDSVSKNMVSVLCTPMQPAPGKRTPETGQSRTQKEFNWDKLETDNSVLSMTSRKNEVSWPKMDASGSEPKTPVKTGPKQSSIGQTVSSRTPKLALKNLNFLSMINAIDQKSVLLGKHKVHFEDQAEAIHLLQGTQESMSAICRRERESREASYIDPGKNRDLLDNIKMYNQMSYFLDNKHLIEMSESPIRITLNPKCSLDGSRMFGKITDVRPNAAGDERKVNRVCE